jgi:pimeloyl-ACP methyl ester carboxylesterase
VKYLLVDKYESWRYVPRIAVPMLILAAEKDEVIPAASTEALRSRFPAGQVTWVRVPGASHNTIGDDPLYVRSLAAFDTTR